MTIPRTKLLRLAADLLELASDRFSNDCCTDWLTTILTRAELVELTRRYEDYNSGGADFDPKQPIGDNWIAMSAVAQELKKLAREST